VVYKNICYRTLFKYIMHLNREFLLGKWYIVLTSIEPCSVVVQCDVINHFVTSYWYCFTIKSILYVLFMHLLLFDVFYLPEMLVTTA